MATGATGQLGLALPVQGELTGTWGDTVNNGITQYTNIAIAATLTLTGDGAVTLANTNGDASASNITSTLTGAGTVTAQFAIVRITGTLTVAKVVTAPSYSKTYTVVNAATGGIVTFKASGQTGVSIAVGESAFVYFNGTDYVKVASTAAGGTVTSVGWTGGIVSVANQTTTPAFTIAGTSGGIPYFNSGTTWATSSALAANALVIGGGAGAAPATTTTGTGVVTALGNTANAAGGLVTSDGTATLSNKRIDPRNVVAASASTLTPDVSVGDIYAYTALAAGLTINAPIGTPTDGDKLIFRFLDNGTARALTWNATYTAIGVTLPTTTIISKTVYIGCIYNANNTRWDVIAVTTQA
jgi:hypothetical protein